MRFALGVVQQAKLCLRLSYESVFATHAQAIVDKDKSTETLFINQNKIYPQDF